MTTKPTVHIGVLLLAPYQLMDAAGPMDMLSMISTDYLTICNAPPHLIAKSTPLQWHYISTTNDLSPSPCSVGPLQLPTVTYSTCPHLDYLIIPGPPPSNDPIPTDLKDFLIKQSETATAILTICSGSLVLAQTGLLNGKKACTNKSAILGLLAQNALPRGPIWQKTGRWVVDGKYWTAGGVHCGVDMAAEFMVEKGLCDLEIKRWAQTGAEVVTRGREEDPYAFLLKDVEIPV